MATSIYKKQQDDHFVRLHQAKDWYYLQSRWIWVLGFWGTLAYGMLLIVLYQLNFDFLSPYVEGAAGLAGLLFGGLLKHKAEQNKRTGAIIQEQIDTELFFENDDPQYWNKILIPEGKVAPELISDAAPKSVKDIKRFKTWYSEGTSANSPTLNEQILKCQRENLSFDYLLRKKFTTRFFWILAVVIVCIIVFAFVANPPSVDLILRIILPLSGFILFVGSTWANNYLAIKEQEDMEQTIRLKLDRLSSKDNEINKADLREIQDFIFKNRANKAMDIPDSFYEKHREHLDQLIIRATDTLNKNT